jgi:RIO-like serine/threonine protein kinase
MSIQKNLRVLAAIEECQTTFGHCTATMVESRVGMAWGETPRILSFLWKGGLIDAGWDDHTLTDEGRVYLGRHEEGGAA